MPDISGNLIVGVDPLLFASGDEEDGEVGSNRYGTQNGAWLGLIERAVEVGKAQLSRSQPSEISACVPTVVERVFSGQPGRIGPLLQQ